MNVENDKLYTPENPLKFVSLGWGIQSWTLVAMSALGEIPKIDYAIHADTTHEAAHTYAHAKKWTPWLEDHGIRVVTVRSDVTDIQNPEVYKGVFIPAYTIADVSKSHGVLNRTCTSRWKIQPIRQFVRTLIPKTQPNIVEAWMGISLDEWTRMRDSDVKYIKNVYPLIDRRINRADCVAWLERNELDVPEKSACVFCPYHNIPTWNRMKQKGGNDWEKAIDIDNLIRDKRENHQLFVHTARKPLEEAVKIPEDYNATQLEMDMVCDSGVCFV